MAVNITGFRARFPEFTDPPFTDGVVQVRLDDAQCDVSRSKLSSSSCAQNKYERIVYNLSAHYLKVWDNTQKGSSAAGGPISSKTVGKVSVSYSRSSSSSQQNEYFMQTIYGQQYLTLLSSVSGGLITVC